MKKYNHISLVIIGILFLGCNQKIEKISKLSSNQILGNGEWLDISDTVNGISIRGNKIAYFENMQFTADEIAEYQIIDSIYQIDGKEKKIGEFLTVALNQDTIQFRIINRDKNSIILNNSEEGTQEFKFWK